MTAERINVDAALSVTGMKRRTLQALAARGKVPGAAKLGGMWYFDRAKLRLWIARQEAEACQPISINAVAFGTPVFKAGVSSYVEAYRRATGVKQRCA